MKNSLIEDIIAGSYSLVLHIVLVTLFIVGMESKSTPKFVAQPKVDIVQATVMNEDQVLQEMAHLQELEDKKLKAEIDRQAKIDKQLEETQKELARKEREFLDQQERAKIEQQQRELKAQQEQEKIKQLEQERKLEDKKRVKAEQARKLEDEKRIKAEKARKVEEERKLKAEQERKVEEERKYKAAEERRAAEEKKRLAEADRKAEEDRKRQAEQDRKKAEEAKRKAEADRKAEELRKQKAVEEARRAEADSLLQQSLAAEQREREEIRVNGVVNQHVSIIRQRVKRYWIRPTTSTESGLQCILRVNLIPSGDVKQVVVVKSSGNAIFDRSAESAVFKAAPFAMPTDPKAAAELRDFQFIFKPE